MQPSTAERILQYIHQVSSPSFFEELPLFVSQAFRLAHEDCENRIRYCELRKNRKRSQDRYFYLQEALLAANACWMPETVVLDNKNESYTQLQTEKLLATVHVSSRYNGQLRSAKYRKENAALNAGLSEQLELIPSLPEESKRAGSIDKLNILVVAVAPELDAAQNEPAQIRILVPFENNRGYHLDIEIDKLLAGFETSEPMPAPEDQAWPTLRKQMRQDEKKSTETQ